MGTTALYKTMATHSVTANTPAKINLTLDVLGTRDDGYHELRSLVIGVDLCDRVRCALVDAPGVSLTCSAPALSNRDNLACRAADCLARHLGREPSARIDIEKRIPVAAGLGGGSSDAAAALRLLNELWDGGLTTRELAAIGADVGSDVPLFFSLPGAVMTGRGELVEPVALCWTGWVLLMFVDQAVSTRKVYQAWRPSDGADADPGRASAIRAATTAGEVSAHLSNDLEGAVFRVAPNVARVYERLSGAGLGPIRVSGAGSTLYGLFDDRDEACRAARKIEDLHIGIETAVVAAPVGPGHIVSEER